MLESLTHFVFTVLWIRAKLLTVITVSGLHGRNAVKHAVEALEGECGNVQIHLRPMVEEIAEAWVPV